METISYLKRIIIILLILSIVQVVMAAPSVTIKKPAASEGPISGNYVLRANVTPDTNISSVNFLYSNTTVSNHLIGNGTNTGNEFIYSWNTSSMANGQYNLNVIARENNGNETSSSVVFSILNTINDRPTVSVISPNGGENLTGTITLSATASDPDGSIANVTFYYSNGTTWHLIGINTSSSGNSYTRNWVTSGNGENYRIKAVAFDNLGAWAEDTSNATFNISNDAIPPHQVTNLTSVEKGKNYINWTWNDPEDHDFSYVKVYLNTTTGTNLYTSTVARGLKYFNSFGRVNLYPNNTYNFCAYAVDTSGNINYTASCNLSSTLPNTGTGNNIEVDLDDGVKITFSNVSVAGNTSKTSYSGATNGNMFTVAGTAYNITTTAVFVSAIIEMRFTSANPEKVRLYHYENENSSWKDITTDRDANRVRGIISSGNSWPVVPGDPLLPKKISPSTDNPITTVGSQPVNITISFDQIVNVSWYIENNSNPVQTNNSVISASYYNNNPSIGTVNITARWENRNGTDSFTWKWIVRSSTYFSGNRIWDSSKPNDFALNYTWTPQSFSGFYYDEDDDVGGESISITLNGYGPSYRTISKNKIVYSTSPNLVSFAYGRWGKYQVVGFMADKYFAGYKGLSNTNPTNSFDNVSAIAQGQLHKVLIDDDTKRTISVGGTLALKEGYVLKASDIDLNARTMFLRLLKDGVEVDSTPLAKDETYVYKKRVGDVDDLPLILVRFDNVFSGVELQSAFMRGIFQISEDITQVKSGNQFGRMEVTAVNKDLIEMRNSDGDVALNQGSTVDLMGDLKIIVADDSDVLRFALSADKKGNFEVRSTVFRETDTPPITEWTPYNFGMNIGKTSIGFYYNMDDGLGNEKLTLKGRDGRLIPDSKLVYSTAPDMVSFNYNRWGKYQVIGFMADKYFAGYKGHNISNPTNSFDDISAISQGELHKILIDDDTKRTIAVGGTLALKDGYVLKATDIDLNARTMFLVLLKDGVEVDSSPLAKDETFVYKKSIGSVSDLPIIMVRFDNVFSGNELQAAFLKGIFQLSESATTVKVGDQYGKMEVTAVNANSITMSNSGSIGLDKNKNDELMGNIKLRVADSDTLRFYFAVDVTDEMRENQLVIDAPARAMAGEKIKINVTAGGNPAENTSVTLDTDIGVTNKDGIVNYDIPRTLKAGTYSITATKTGYEKATKNIEIEKYVDYSLTMEAPAKANQYETINIKVLYNGTVMSGATIMFDNTTIGTTDSNGEMNYKLETSGTHSITASKTSYIAVSRDIDIIAPYSEYKALEIKITPNPVFTNENFMIQSNITNIGTKKDTLPVDLIINGSAVDNRSVTLGPGEKVEINFTRKESKAANVTVEILGQSTLLEVKEKPTNYLLIGVIGTLIGAVVIYVLTSKGLLNLELLKEKIMHLFKK